jgi:arylsulfatase A-like enzyme
MTKVGMPGAKVGWQKTDVTLATVLKTQGYATGQFGKNHLDGYNQLTYLSGKTAKSPRREFIYLNDAAEVVAIRFEDWKAVHLENRAKQMSSMPVCWMRSFQV